MQIKLKYKLATPVLMWAIVFVGGFILWQFVPPGAVFTSGITGLVILLLGVVYWGYVLYASTRVHRQAGQSAADIERLVVEGPYAVIRHPIYAADILLALCAFIFHPTYRVFAVAAWLAIVLIFWANFEERVLEDKFLDQYREYRKRVPMLIPRFRK